MQLDGFVTSHSWIALVPVKASASAKSRLEPTKDRPELAHAMAQDTITALLATSTISRVYVVTPQPGEFIDHPDLRYVEDHGREGLNSSLRSAAEFIRQVESDYGLAIVLADLPCLTEFVMQGVLAEAGGISVVSDVSGVGTTMLLHPQGTEIPGGFRPRFGHHSCAKHVAAGATNIAEFLPSEIRARAQRDVDTPADLWDATRLGVGTQTWSWGGPTS